MLGIDKVDIEVVEEADFGKGNSYRLLHKPVGTELDRQDEPNEADYWRRYSRSLRCTAMVLRQLKAHFEILLPCSAGNGNVETGNLREKNMKHLHPPHILVWSYQPESGSRLEVST